MHSAGRRVNLDIVNDGDVTKWTPLQRMRYSEMKEKLGYQRMATGFGRGVRTIPIAVWANKAVLAKAATRDRSATMAAGGGDLSIYINGRLPEKKATRRIDAEKKTTITINRPSKTRVTSWQAFGSFLRRWQAKKRLRLSAWRREIATETDEEKKRPTPREKRKEAPEGGE